MSKRLLGARARQCASFLALCTVAGTALADPISLTGTCHLRSLLPGGGVCDLSYTVGDDFGSPSSVKAAQVRVDGKLVTQFINDASNPVDFAAPLISGSVTVACGVGHLVNVSIAPLGVATVYAKVGNLPNVKCPVAPT